MYDHNINKTCVLYMHEWRYAQYRYYMCILILSTTNAYYMRMHTLLAQNQYYTCMLTIWLQNFYYICMRMLYAKYMHYVSMLYFYWFYAYIIGFKGLNFFIPPILKICIYLCVFAIVGGDFKFIWDSGCHSKKDWLKYYICIKVLLR